MNPSESAILAYLEAAAAAFAEADFARAVQLAEDGLRLDPHDLDLRMCLAHAAFQLGDYTRAVAAYGAAIKVDPRYAEAYACRGVCLHETRHYEQALADLTYALQLDPRDASFWSNRGRVYYDLKQYANALEDHRQSIELAPLRDDYHYLAGEACLYLGENELAWECFQEACRLNPDKPEYLAERGAALFHLGRYEQALSDLNHSLRLDPHAIVPFYYRGQVLLKLGDKRHAFDDFSTLLARDSSWTSGYFERGKLLLEARRFAEAAADFSVAIERMPDNLTFYRLRAEAYRGCGQTELAERDRQVREQTVRRQLAELAPRGVRVVVSIVQAFGELYSSAYASDAYAAVVLTFDESLQRNPAALRALALGVGRLKGTHPADPELLALARVLARERGERHRRLPIPAAIAGSALAYLADLWIYRPFLPSGKLDESGLLECLAEPGNAGRLELLPQSPREPDEILILAEEANHDG